MKTSKLLKMLSNYKSINVEEKTELISEIVKYPQMLVHYRELAIEIILDVLLNPQIIFKLKKVSHLSFWYYIITVNYYDVKKVNLKSLMKAMLVFSEILEDAERAYNIFELIVTQNVKQVLTNLHLINNLQFLEKILIKWEKAEMYIDYFVEKLNSKAWEAISQNRNLSKNFIEKHDNKLNMKIVLDFIIYSDKKRLKRFSDEFFTKYIKYIDWSLFCSKKVCSEKFYCMHAEKLDWIEISRALDNFSNSFIKHNEKNIHWEYVAKQKLFKFSIFYLQHDFLYKYNLDFSKFKLKKFSKLMIKQQLLEFVINEIGIENALQFINFDESYLETIIDKVDPLLILETQTLSEYFIEKYISMFDLDKIIQTQNVSEYFVEKYYDKIKDKNSILRGNSKLSINFLERHIDDFEFEKILEIFEFKANTFHFGLENIVLFLERHKDRISDWNKILNLYVPDYFIILHFDKFDHQELLEYIKRTDTISIMFYKKCIDTFSENELQSLELLSKVDYEFFSESFALDHVKENTLIEDYYKLSNFSSLFWRDRIDICDKKKLINILLNHLGFKGNLSLLLN